MSTWFPEETPPGEEYPGRSQRPPFPGQHADGPTPASGDSYELPTRRSAQAAAAAQEARQGRGEPAQNLDTQFLPPVAGGEDEPGRAGRSGRPELFGTPPGVTPPGVPTYQDPVSYRDPVSYPRPYQDPVSYRDPVSYQDPVTYQEPVSYQNPSPASYGAPYGEQPPPAGGYPVLWPAAAPTDPPPVTGQPSPGPGGGPEQLVQPLPGPELPAGRSRGGELHGRAPAQSLSRLSAALAWPVMALGLFVSESDHSAFGRTPAWSAFALICLVLVGVGAFGGRQGPGSGHTLTLGLVGAGGLVVFWVLLVLPEIHRNTSFALTLGTTLAGVAMWLTPGRRRG